MYPSCRLQRAGATSTGSAAPIRTTASVTTHDSAVTITGLRSMFVTAWCSAASCATRDEHVDEVGAADAGTCERRTRARAVDQRDCALDRQRRQPAGLVGEQVGHRAAETDRHQRTELFVDRHSHAQVEPGSGHRLHHHRVGVVAERGLHARDGIGDGVAVVEIEGDASVQRATDVAVARLDGDRVTDRVGGGDGLVGRNEAGWLA